MSSKEFFGILLINDWVRQNDRGVELYINLLHHSIFIPIYIYTILDYHAIILSLQFMNKQFDLEKYLFFQLNY